MAKNKSQSFYKVITDAINDFALYGYDSQWRVDYWVQRIEEAAKAALVPEVVLQRELTAQLQSVYEKLVNSGKIAQHHPGVAQFTLLKVKPKLRAELDRRILASAKLIQLNRNASIGRTLRRFQGWATSIPMGGSEAIDRKEEKAGLRKAMASLPFEERRVIIDQGHKLVASINDIVAVDGGAIAGIWHSHWRQAGYNYRKDHKERDERIYTIRGNWALQEGLMKVGPDGYTDKITQPGEEVFCRCFYSYLYSIEDLPDYMITAKAKKRLAELEI